MAEPSPRAMAAAEVQHAFVAYEAALVANDVAAMDAAFWNDERVVRFGIHEGQHGFAAIARLRAPPAPVPADRRLVRTDVVPVADDVVVVSTVFVNGDDPTIGRQQQTWVRVDDGWKIVAAHVSMCDPPPDAPTLGP